jgi:hypothetical protein
MGFFSSNCEGCGHPLLSSHATNDINSWMEQVVAIKSNGSLIMGDYDGYGSIGGVECAIEDATVWHVACFKHAGRPYEYRGPSPRAHDQGYFFDDGDHDMAEPASAVLPFENMSLPQPSSMESALRLIMAVTNGRCGNYFNGEPGECFNDRRVADARYGYYQACGCCIAHYGLTGKSIPVNDSTKASR